METETPNFDAIQATLNRRTQAEIRFGPTLPEEDVDRHIAHSAQRKFMAIRSVAWMGPRSERAAMTPLVLAKLKEAEESRLFDKFAVGRTIYDDFFATGELGTPSPFFGAGSRRWLVGRVAGTEYSGWIILAEWSAG